MEAAAQVLDQGHEMVEHRSMVKTANGKGIEGRDLEEASQAGETVSSRQQWGYRIRSYR